MRFRFRLATHDQPSSKRLTGSLALPPVGVVNMPTDSLRRLADQMLREGYVDNEPDALQAALRVFLAVAERDRQPPEPQPPPPGRGADSDHQISVGNLMMERL